MTSVGTGGPEGGASVGTQPMGLDAYLHPPEKLIKIILALEKVDSGLKYGHVWYLCEISGVCVLKKQVTLFCFIDTTYILHHILYSPYLMANGIGLPFGIAGEIQKSPFRIRLKSFIQLNIIRISSFSSFDSWNQTKKARSNEVFQSFQVSTR